MMGLIPHYKTFEIKLIPIAINNKVEKNGVSFYKNGCQDGCQKLANKCAKNKKPPLKINSTGVIRRDGKIRTCDLLVPNQAR